VTDRSVEMVAEGQDCPATWVTPARASRQRPQMPWKETSSMKERKQLYTAWLRGDATVAELSRRFGISRKTAYKWLMRASNGEDEEFTDRSRRPKTNPKAIEPWLVDSIIEARKMRPTWGPKKLRAVLAASNPRTKLPAVATFAAIFKRHGLVRPRKRRIKTPPFSAPLAHATAPNKLWCVDFKGHFPVGTRRCYPLTITDAFSRYVIACVALTNTRTKTVKRVFDQVFVAYGLPESIRSDNGEPFASKAVCGFSQLSAWWWTLGIRHERIQPGHPEQNGRHERMHLTLKQETASPPSATMRAQQRAFDLFRATFNDERPHEALGMHPPTSCYEVSKRVLPERAGRQDFDYPIGHETTRVSRFGTVSTSAGSFFVSTALVGQWLGLEWTPRGDWDLWFGAQLLGRVRRIKGRARRAELIAVREVSPMSSDKLSPMSAE
jgi:putative transposase